MFVEPSVQVHANQADEVFMRVGDKSKKLSFEDRTQLIYDKGMRYFEDSPVADAELDDLDMDFVQDYVTKIGYSKTPLEYLMQNKGFIRKKNDVLQISAAAILLFGKHPQTYFPRARVRFIRYEGTEEKFGTQMNVIKDVVFDGNILKMAQQSIAFLDTQIKEKTYLGSDGTFVTEEEYPKFVRQEIIINAITHRDYSIKGTDIQVKMFEDRIVVESPGKLPGLVKPENIRSTHFSRNPKLAEFLKVFKYVKEFGEGVNRMFDEMKTAGLPEPLFIRNNFMLQTIIRNKKDSPARTTFPEQVFETLPIEQEKLPIDDKKLPIEQLETYLIGKNVSSPTRNAIVRFFQEIDVTQSFGRKEVERIVKCSYRNAGNLIVMMKELAIIEAVIGKGKGKYILKSDRFLDADDVT
jgi:ATP-dependent DNA helicase RecG